MFTLENFIHEDTMRQLGIDAIMVVQSGKILGFGTHHRWAGASQRLFCRQDLHGDRNRHGGRRGVFAPFRQTGGLL